MANRSTIDQNGERSGGGGGGVVLLDKWLSERQQHDNFSNSSAFESKQFNESKRKQQPISTIKYNWSNDPSQQGFVSEISHRVFFPKTIDRTLN